MAGEACISERDVIFIHGPVSGLGRHCKTDTAACSEPTVINRICDDLDIKNVRTRPFVNRDETSCITDFTNLSARIALRFLDEE